MIKKIIKISISIMIICFFGMMWRAYMEIWNKIVINEETTDAIFETFALTFIISILITGIASIFKQEKEDENTKYYP